MRDSKPDWQKILAEGFASAHELLDFLQLPHTLASDDAQKQFKTRVPQGFAALMEPGNPLDPLLLQVLPQAKELTLDAGYATDPLQEAKANPLPGLIHKYSGRVLLTLAGACAINCRYCFRRHFPYENNNPGRHGWDPVLQYIAHDNTISEVILSGGDPLLAKDAHLAPLISQLSAISHVKTLRIHSRIPVVLPERIDDSFLRLFADFSLQKVMVLHSNHPRELDDRVFAASRRLREADMLLLNQSVLLAGVNNNADILVQLSRRLFACGILPYYLHLLDKVQGAHHFDVPLQEAKKLYQVLQSQLPGYLVPRLVREEAGVGHKTLIL